MIVKCKECGYSWDSKAKKKEPICPLCKSKEIEKLNEREAEKWEETQEEEMLNIIKNIIGENTNEELTEESMKEEVIKEDLKPPKIKKSSKDKETELSNLSTEELIKEGFILFENYMNGKFEKEDYPYFYPEENNIRDNLAKILNKKVGKVKINDNTALIIFGGLYVAPSLAFMFHQIKKKKLKLFKLPKIRRKKKKEEKPKNEGTTE